MGSFFFFFFQVPVRLGTEFSSIFLSVLSVSNPKYLLLCMKGINLLPFSYLQKQGINSWNQSSAYSSMYENSELRTHELQVSLKDKVARGKI